MSSIPYTVEVIEKLRWNSHLSKHSHFFASHQGRNSHVLCGVPVVIINLLLGSVFFALASTTLPEWSKWIGAILALIAAGLGGIQTFFNFRDGYEGHREIANEYLGIARECERLIALYFDELLNLENLSQNIESLNTQYSSINQRAEDYSVSKQAYQQALAIQQKKSEDEPSLVQKVKLKLSGEV